MQIEIRSVCPEDDRMAISYVYEASWRHAYRGIVPQPYLDALPRGHWSKFPDLDGFHSLVALDGEKIVGTACCCASRWKEWGNEGELVSLYLLPEYMGKGIGKGLLTAAEENLRAGGYRSAFLWVLEGNASARKFYEHMGFQPTEDFLLEDVGGAQLRTLRYWKQIVPGSL